jgi:hypothetical protein
MAWSHLGAVAPHTKNVLEMIGGLSLSPVLDVVPEYLEILDQRSDPIAWAIELDKSDNASGISNREVLLRYVLSRAIVDQGSDIEGVEMWHSRLLERSYAMGFRILHDPAQFVQNYEEILKIGAKVRDEVFAERASLWANQEGSGKRHLNSYTPFNVDGLRGSKQTNWFMSARLFPAILLSKSRHGGLVDLVFGNMPNETPLEMSRRVRNDSVYGLGYCIGDKACDLFCKWAIGTYRLGCGLESSWDPSDSPLPMDQRIGRLMIRTGFMDEFFGVSRMMAGKQFGFNPEDDQTRPNTGEDIIPDGRWFLRVMEFRRKSRVEKGAALTWLKDEWREGGRSEKPPRFGPQEVIGLLCKSLNREKGLKITPVEIDDNFMRIGGSVCTDVDPQCTKCDLQFVCQANTDPQKSNLKFCYT